MKKEKTIKAHTRKTKSGKTVNVRQHKASYEAAEDIVKDALRKKKGAGEELASRMKKEGKYEVLGVDLSELTDEQFKDFAEGFFAWDEKGKEHVAPTTRAGFKRFCEKWYSGWEEKQNFKDGWEEYRRENLSGASSKKSPKSSRASYSMGFTKEEFNDWYEGAGTPADKKVEKILRKALGKKAYTELSDTAADNYDAGGAHKFFRKFVAESSSNENATSGKPLGPISTAEVKKLARKFGVSPQTIADYIQGREGKGRFGRSSKEEFDRFVQRIQGTVVDATTLPRLHGDFYALEDSRASVISYDKFDGGNDNPPQRVVDSIGRKAAADLKALRKAGFTAVIVEDGNYDYIEILDTPTAKAERRKTFNDRQKKLRSAQLKNKKAQDT